MRPPRGFGVACGPEPRMSVGGAVGEDEGGGPYSLSGEKPQRSPLPATIGASPGRLPSTTCSDDAWPPRSTGGRRPDACRFSSARRTFRVECTSSACRPPTRLACFPCTNDEGSSDDLGCAADGGRVFKEFKRPVPLSYALVSLLSGPPLVPGRTHTHFSST